MKLKQAFSLVQSRLRLLLTSTNRKVKPFRDLKKLVKEHFDAKAYLPMNITPYCLTFAKSNVEGEWGSSVLSVESIFNSDNDGPVLLTRPRGQYYDSQDMSTSARSGFVSIWGTRPIVQKSM